MHGSLRSGFEVSCLTRMVRTDEELFAELLDYQRDHVARELVTTDIVKVSSHIGVKSRVITFVRCVTWLTVNSTYRLGAL
jgi:hypothetical protein